VGVARNGKPDGDCTKSEPVKCRAGPVDDGGVSIQTAEEVGSESVVLPSVVQVFDEDETIVGRALYQR
jgi:hypothetical protein